MVGEALRDWHERGFDRQQDIARLKGEIDRAADNPARLSLSDARQPLRQLYAQASSAKAS